MTVKGKHSDYIGTVDKEGIVDRIEPKPVLGNGGGSVPQPNPNPVNPEDLALLEVVLPGHVLSFEDLEKEVTVTKDDKTVVITVGDTIYINGEGEESEILGEITYNGNKYVISLTQKSSNSSEIVSVRYKIEMADIYGTVYAGEFGGENAYICIRENIVEICADGAIQLIANAKVFENKVYIQSDDSTPFLYNVVPIFKIADDGSKITAMISETDSLDLPRYEGDKFNFEYLYYSDTEGLEEDKLGDANLGSTDNFIFRDLYYTKEIKPKLGLAFFNDEAKNGCALQVFPNTGIIFPNMLMAMKVTETGDWAFISDMSESSLTYSILGNIDKETKKLEISESSSYFGKGNYNNKELPKYNKELGYEIYDTNKKFNINFLGLDIFNVSGTVSYAFGEDSNKEKEYVFLLKIDGAYMLIKEVDATLEDGKFTTNEIAEDVMNQTGKTWEFTIGEDMIKVE